MSAGAGWGAATATGRYALRRAGASAGSLIRERGGRSSRVGGGGAAPWKLAGPEQGHGRASEKGS